MRRASARPIRSVSTPASRATRPVRARTDERRAAAASNGNAPTATADRRSRSERRRAREHPHRSRSTRSHAAPQTPTPRPAARRRTRRRPVRGEQVERGAELACAARRVARSRPRPDEQLRQPARELQPPRVGEPGRAQHREHLRRAGGRPSTAAGSAYASRSESSPPINGTTLLEVHARGRRAARGCPGGSRPAARSRPPGARRGRARRTAPAATRRCAARTRT